MQEKLNKISDIICIVLMVVLGIVAVYLTHSQHQCSSEEVSVPTEAVVEEVVEPTVAQVEDTQPVVDNIVEDVDNSVEPAEPLYTKEELEILAIIRSGRAHV